MKRIEDLYFTDAMEKAKAIIEKRGYVLVGWDVLDYGNTLSLFRERRFQEDGICIYTFEAPDGLIYKSFVTDFYPGGKTKSCMIFRRVKK